MTKEPIYDDGAYCVEIVVEGRWKKKKTGKYLSRNYNHITLAYALHHFEDFTRQGRAIRIVYEPTSRVVRDNCNVFTSEAYTSWHRYLDNKIAEIKTREGNRVRASEVEVYDQR